MLSTKAEGFCFGVITVLTAILILNCLPMKIDVLPKSQLGSLTSSKNTDKYITVSKSGIVAETILFEKESDNIILLKDRSNKPLAHISSGKAISWAPKEDILLIEKTTPNGGFQLVDVTSGTLQICDNDITFGQSYAKASFSNQGRDIKMFTKEGFFKKLPVNIILHRKESSSNFAMINE